MKNTYKPKDSPSPKKKAKEKKLNLNFLSKVSNPVTDFVKNEKVHKLTGLSLILVAFYLLIAFISFLFTWKIDHDKLYGSWWSLITDPELVVENWLGKLGAILSHQFIYDWFGVSSFIFVLFAFLAGFRLLFNFNLLPLKQTLKHGLFNLVWVSVFMGYLFHDKLIFLGGSFGFESNKWLTSLLGKTGTGFILVFVLISFGILSFNFSLDFVKSFFENKADKALQELEEDEDNAPLYSAEKGEIDLKNSTPLKTVFPTENVSEMDANELSDEDIAPVLKSTSQPEIAEEPSVELSPVVEVKEKDPVSEGLKMEVEIPEEPKVEVAISEQITEEAPVDDHAMQVEDTTEVSDELKKSDVEKKLEDFGEYDPTLDLAKYKNPPFELLADHGDGGVKVDEQELEVNKDNIVRTLGHYKIGISKIKATIGPTVTLYEIIPEAGVRISKIKNLEDDIALSLAALGIRIIAPIPGKGTVGIEVPNKKPDVVSMRTVIASEKFQNAKMELPVAFGKTIQNETFVVDLAKMPHLLMAGATGQGKSVGLNAILVSLLYKKHPSQLKFVLVDPKKVELTLFNKIERHFLAKLPDEAEPIITDTKKVVATLNSLCVEMDSRYEILKTAQCRNIIEYNKKFISRKLNPANGHKYLPYIVLVIDEFADLIMTAGKEVETPIARLAQLARAIGIHLIVATQRPSVNVITGIIKANFPSRVAFKVTSKTDSRTILDAGGADQLIGRGDMLYSAGSDIIRLQCAFVDTPEVEEITDFIGNQQGYPDAFLLPEYVDESAAQQSSDISADDRDALFEDAARLVVGTQQGSTSLIQRKLKLGYNRAGRIVDQLEAAGILGPFEGSKARQVLYPDEYSLEQFLNSEQSDSE